jgi:hypothetical protein
MANAFRQAEEQDAFVTIWPGFTDRNVATAISQSHKQIVRWAMGNHRKEICIMEDDAEFLGAGAFDFFLQNKPASYDIYLGTASNIIKKDGEVVKWFTGMMLYMVHERFYHKFLGVPENVHIDSALRGLGDYYLCPKIVAREKPGYSYNRKQVLDRTYLANQFEKYGEEKKS